MALIGDGRVLRVCDLCGGVDDHPRHVLAGGRRVLNDPDAAVPAITYQPPRHDIVQRVIANTAALGADDELPRLIGELYDQSSQDRHADCCRAAGCPTGTCDTLPDATGADLLAHLDEQRVTEVPAGDDHPDWDRRLAVVPAAVVVATVVMLLAVLTGRLMLAVRGLSAANTANAWLNVFSGTTFTGAAGSFIQLHTGDPGATGVANVSSVTTRPSATWAAASAGSKAINNTPTWSNWAGTSPETVTDVANFSASTAGTFYFSVQLTASKTVQTGDTLTLTSLSVALSPIAA